MPSESAVDFEFLAKYSADVICRAGSDLAIEYLSPSSLELLGWRPEERIGQKAYDLIIPEDRPIFMKAYQRLLEGAESVCAAVRMRKRDGSIVWMEGNARLMRDSATEAPKGLLSSCATSPSARSWKINSPRAQSILSFLRNTVPTSSAAPGKTR
jgi:PAS domain S-box-containing protein